MLKYNNTHIFTGYLKQLLSTVNIPTCKIYTEEFKQYFKRYNKESPCVLESFDTISESRLATRNNYIINGEIYNYVCANTDIQKGIRKGTWEKTHTVFYDSEHKVNGLTKTLYSQGGRYDTATHEYLGDYLRFLRDYYNVNLMSLYNCFTNKICNNLYYNDGKINFNSYDQKYKIYSLPVKLFASYTIAIDCDYGVELFCGLYNTNLAEDGKNNNLIQKTHHIENKTMFNKPFLFDKLDVKHWSFEATGGIPEENNKAAITRWDIANREQDLRLFIKIPASCHSTITILEGDFRTFNDCKYLDCRPDNLGKENIIDLGYLQNSTTINFDCGKDELNDLNFRPINKIKLLSFNTGESYPFSDRLIEYLVGSTITSTENIPDNIKRVQNVMRQNGHHFKINGAWENKIQKIIYDYLTNSGPIQYSQKTNMLKDVRNGDLSKFGQMPKSLRYDVLGYVDKEAEKLYASWSIQNDKPVMQDTIQNTDIYIDKNGKSLYDF